MTSAYNNAFAGDANPQAMLSIILPVKVCGSSNRVARCQGRVGALETWRYKDKTDYYYNTNIPFFKKMMTKKVVQKIIDGFE